MSFLFYVAATLAIAIGLAHSILGEKYILVRLFRRDDLPHLFGSDWFTIRTLRFAWHVTTIAWWGFAAIMILLALGRADTTNIAIAVSVTFLVTAAVALIGSKARHLSWPVFLIIGLACLMTAMV